MLGDRGLRQRQQPDEVARHAGVSLRQLRDNADPRRVSQRAEERGSPLFFNRQALDDFHGRSFLSRVV